MRKFVKTILVVPLVVLLASCGSTGSAGTSAASKEGSTVLIMNQPAGNPFADLVYAGMVKAAEEKASVPSRCRVFRLVLMSSSCVALPKRAIILLLYYGTI